MSAVNITNVAVLDNPSAFLNPFQFEISYECLASLKDGNSTKTHAYSALYFISVSLYWMNLGKNAHSVFFGVQLGFLQ